jgi:predicted small metal-binding protein
MKEFFCGDIVQGCTAKFQAPDDASILQAVAEHAHLEHGIADVPTELVDQVRALIRDSVTRETTKA